MQRTSTKDTAVAFLPLFQVNGKTTSPTSQTFHVEQDTGIRFRYILAILQS